MATTTQPTDAASTLDPKVAASAFDFLLIELVPLAHRIAADLHARDTALLSSSLERNATLNTSTTASSSTHASSATATDKRQSLKSTDAATGQGGALSTTTTTALTTTLPLLNDDDPSDLYDEDLQDSLQESILYRLDSLGYRVGLGLVEKLSQNSARPTTALDMIKFVCKDLWQVVFRKQIDNLKTNHRGTFVLTDNKFLALGRMSVDRGRGPRGAEEALRKAQPFLYFPCGIIRGALAGFGLSVSVHAETSELPQAIFQIRTVGSKP
ncbi:transport protein particle component [Aureobasidium sp. EXF-12298]|nr:transport protein particle component [Aureobasidium sp. EXF-12298]KAI4762281.1 transport protein particle component [Aureobasidium sp. EXF-12344]KAI4781687.1 transport protein particle component [Aureobasidium sp. EXF-3400]